MSISLRDIDENNFWQCINLNVADRQEGFVASNVRSIAESKVYPYLVPQAIYNNEIPVGFAMYGRDPQTENYWIVRFMIGAQHQSQGYGRSALAALIEKIKNLSEAGEVFLSFVPANTAAEKFYSSFGFERTGETNDDGEFIMRLSFKEKESDNRALTADN